LGTEPPVGSISPASQIRRCSDEQGATLAPWRGMSNDDDPRCAARRASSARFSADSCPMRVCVAGPELTRSPRTVLERILLKPSGPQAGQRRTAIRRECTDPIRSRPRSGGADALRTLRVRGKRFDLIGGSRRAIWRLRRHDPASTHYLGQRRDQPVRRPLGRRQPGREPEPGQPSRVVGPVIAVREQQLRRATRPRVPTPPW
jgi:hypothetical protein